MKNWIFFALWRFLNCTRTIVFLNDFKLYGLDISRQALKVAKKNARIHKLNKKIAFLRSNLLEKLKDEKIDLMC